MWSINSIKISWCTLPHLARLRIQELQTARMRTKETAAKRTFWRTIKTTPKTFKSRTSSLGNLTVALVWTNISSIRVSRPIMASTVFNKLNLIRIPIFIIHNRSSKLHINNFNNRDTRKLRRMLRWGPRATMESAPMWRRRTITRGAMPVETTRLELVAPIACYIVFNSILPSQHKPQRSNLLNRSKTVKSAKILK